MRSPHERSDTPRATKHSDLGQALPAGIPDADVVDESSIAPELNLPRQWAQAVEGVATVLRVVVAGLLVGLLLVLAWNIAIRLFNVSGYDIPTEIVVLGFTWMVFLGSAVLVQEWQHIEVPMVFQLVRGTRARLAAHAVVVVLCLVFSVVLTGSAWRLVGASMSRSSPMLHLPTPIWYASVLVGFSLICAALLLRLGAYVRAWFLQGHQDA